MSGTVRRIVTTTDAPPPGGPYSQAVIAGNTMYISGQIGRTLEGKMIGDAVEAQCEQVLKNIRAVCKAAGQGTDMKNIVKMTVLLADINDWPKCNNVYKTFFDGNFPARAAYAVKDLPMGAKVEIEAVAIVGPIDDQ